MSHSRKINFFMAKKKRVLVSRRSIFERIRQQRQVTGKGFLTPAIERTSEEPRQSILDIIAKQQERNIPETRVRARQSPFIEFLRSLFRR